MSDTELRAKNGALLGKIKVLSGGRLEGRDAKGALRGHYCPKSDQTRKSNGALYGQGNLLAVLITQ